MPVLLPFLLLLPRRRRRRRACVGGPGRARLRRRLLLLFQVLLKHRLWLLLRWLLLWVRRRNGWCRRFSGGRGRRGAFGVGIRLGVSFIFFRLLGLLVQNRSGRVNYFWGSRNDLWRCGDDWTARGRWPRKPRLKLRKRRSTRWRIHLRWRWAKVPNVGLRRRRGRRSGVTLNLMRNEKRERSRSRGRRRGRRRRNEQLTLNLVKSPSRNDGGSPGISEPGGDEVYGRGGRRGDVTRSRHLSGQFLLEPIHLRLHLPHLGVRQMRHCQSRSSLVKEDRRFRLLRYTSLQFKVL